VSYESTSDDLRVLSSLVDRLESGELTHSPEELARAQGIVDSLEASPCDPDPRVLAEFIALAGSEA
jgi:hypothetical protein